MDEIDWKAVAVRLALGEGTYHKLTTAERDSLEDAIREAGHQPPGLGPVGEYELGPDGLARKRQ